MAIATHAVKKRTVSVAYYAVLCVTLLIVLVPICYLVFSSFRFVRDLVSQHLTGGLTLFNFRELLTGSSFGSYFRNSTSLIIGTTVLTLLVSSPAAYSLSKLRWHRGMKSAVLGLVLFIQFVPPVVLVPAFYQALVTAGYFNTVIGLVAVNTLFQVPFATFVLLVYFDSFPSALREAALVDGASESKVFFKIALPLQRPALVTVGLLVAIMTWNEFLLALTLTASPHAQPITVGIADYIQQYSVQYGNVMAAAVIGAIPLILVALFAHKHIVAGLTRGGLRG